MSAYHLLGKLQVKLRSIARWHILSSLPILRVPLSDMW